MFSHNAKAVLLTEDTNSFLYTAKRFLRLIKSVLILSAVYGHRSVFQAAVLAVSSATDVGGKQVLIKEVLSRRGRVAPAFPHARVLHLL